MDAIITEDSDALVFGCARVLFKLESNGMAQQVLHKDLFENKLEGGLDMRGWTQEMFQVLCVVGGNCDYIASLPGLGLRTVRSWWLRIILALKKARLLYQIMLYADDCTQAYKYVHRHKTLSKVIKAIRLEAKIKVPPDYEDRCQEVRYWRLVSRTTWGEVCHEALLLHFRVSGSVHLQSPASVRPDFKDCVSSSSPGS